MSDMACHGRISARAAHQHLQPRTRAPRVTDPFRRLSRSPEPGQLFRNFFAQASMRPRAGPESAAPRRLRADQKYQIAIPELASKQSPDQ